MIIQVLEQQQTRMHPDGFQRVPDSAGSSTVSRDYFGPNLSLITRPNPPNSSIAHQNHQMPGNQILDQQHAMAASYPCQSYSMSGSQISDQQHVMTASPASNWKLYGQNDHFAETDHRETSRGPHAPTLASLNRPQLPAEFSSGWIFQGYSNPTPNFFEGLSSKPNAVKPIAQPTSQAQHSHPEPPTLPLSLEIPCAGPYGHLTPPITPEKVISVAGEITASHSTKIGESFKFNTAARFHASSSSTFNNQIYSPSPPSPSQFGHCHSRPIICTDSTNDGKTPKAH